MVQNLGNYVLERVPEGERPSYLAWYNLALNAGILAGSLLGPVIADWVGLSMALWLIAGGRLAAALALWRWG